MKNHHCQLALAACIAFSCVQARATATSDSNADANQPAPADISLSLVTAITPTTLPPGVSTPFCITANLRSIDLEYIDRFQIDLPDGWTIDSVASDSNPPATGCSPARPVVSGVATGNVLYWQSNGALPTTCGAWFTGQTGSDYTFCAQVTVPTCSGAPWQPAWTIIGDGYGAAPHVVSDIWSSLACAAPGTPNIDVAPGSLASTQRVDSTRSQVLTITNNGSADLAWSIVEEPMLERLAVSCSAPGDVAWLSLSDTSGTMGPMEYMPLTVTFDSTGLTAGTWLANLCVHSNDPDAGPGNGSDLVIVPVTLNIDDTIFSNGFES